MKKLSKVLVLVLSAIMVLAMSASVFAASIEVQDVLDGETYTAYKILNYTQDGDAYSYFLTAEEYEQIGSALEAAGFHFTPNVGSTKYTVDNAKTIDVAAAAESLASANIGNALGKFTAIGADGEANFENLSTGYYFVTTTAGSLCALHSETDIAKAVEKNTMLTDEKVVDDASKNAQVGDVLNYTITLTDGKGTNLAATLTDKLSKGLTFNNDAKASINGGEAASVTPAVTENADGSTTVVYTFDAATMTALQEGQKIVVTYTATVNTDASLDGTVTNTEYTEYSEQKTDGNTVEVKLSDLTINKTDGTKALKGAKFELHRGSADSAALKVRALTDEELEAADVTKAADTVYYTIDTTGTNTTIDMSKASSAVVYGTDKDSDYYLVETEAPEGYNPLPNPVKVDAGKASIDVVNEAGAELPSTGGIGTTIFYILGSLLVVGCGIVLVSRKRMQNNK